MSVWEDQIDGVLCSECGMFLHHEYGYPVLCKHCWREAKKRGDIVRQSSDAVDPYDGNRKGFVEITKDGYQREPCKRERKRVWEENA